MEPNKSALRQLNRGKLPKMVRWFDPRLLARIWVRTIISNVFGQYADQRLLQAATDRVDKQTLVARYDYSDLNSPDPEKCLKCDPSGAVWVDYTADTGDGFDALYAMSYLLAQEQLDIPEAGKLPRGEVLIHGGDQAYPQATREEYERRFILPLSWAHTSPHNKRKAFAIPGNHDWYDGLAAFDSLFCAARDSLSEGQGNTIGGWNFKQHRSYWAMKLPHDWWIWGADIQFSKYLDNAQVNYFEAIAEKMGPNDNLVICLAEPAWLLVDQNGIDEEENLFKLATLARARGANVAAVIAGDWHHYNRYYASEIGAHFFTAGGGGAFLHSTQVLKDDISVAWPERRDEDEPHPIQDGPLGKPNVGPGKGVGAKGEQWTAKNVEMRLKKPDKTKAAPQDMTAVERGLNDIINRGGQGGAAGAERSSKHVRTKERAPKCYPSKKASALLSLRNLAFPIYNMGFALGIGLIYWFLTWRFHSITKETNIAEGAINGVSMSSYWSVMSDMPGYILWTMFGGVSFFVSFVALAVSLIWYVHATSIKGFRRWLVKVSLGSLHFLAHAVAMFSIFLLLTAFNNWLAPAIQTSYARIMNTAPQQSEGVVRDFVRKQLEGMSEQSDEQRKISEQNRSPDGTTRSMVPKSGLTPLKPLPETTVKLERTKVRRFVGLLYPFEIAILGGLLGGLIWGAYWVVTGLLWRMHTEDAFAALRIKHYKNFLRMRFDRDKLTIYPIGLDKVPKRRTGWQAAPASGSNMVNQPRLIAKVPLEPELIEEPIVIYSRRSV